MLDEVLTAGERDDQMSGFGVRSGLPACAADVTQFAVLEDARVEHADLVGSNFVVNSSDTIETVFEHVGDLLNLVPHSGILSSGSKHVINAPSSYQRSKYLQIVEIGLGAVRRACFDASHVNQAGTKSCHTGQKDQHLQVRHGTFVQTRLLDERRAWSFILGRIVT